jgi:threonine dehydrogenase-like Zn-dependent dehydrogenase
LKQECPARSLYAMPAEQDDTTHAPRSSSSQPRHSMVNFFFTRKRAHYLFIRLSGTLTRWHVHPAQWLHKLPENVSYEEGALCEPLAVALAGIERAELRLGDPTLIW